MAHDEDERCWGRPAILERGGSQSHYWVVGPEDGPLTGTIARDAPAWAGNPTAGTN